MQSSSASPGLTEYLYSVQAELELRRRAREKQARDESLARTTLVDSPLIDFIPRVVRSYSRPVHLISALREIERCETAGSVRLILNVPPRHAKSHTILLFLIRYLMRHPTRTVAYVTYNAKQTIAKSREAREFALRAGLNIPSDAKALSHWYTPQGGGAIFTTVAGSELTGQGMHVLVVDDPHKTREEAESLVERDRVWAFYRGVAVDRLEPGGSMIVTHTRWNQDDLTGRLLREEPEVWHRVNLKAIADEDETDPEGNLIRRAGDALWPERWPVDNEVFRYQQKKNSYEWFSKYQGEPRARTGAIFLGTALYDALPRTLRAVGIGVDLAFARKTSKDWSAAIAVGLGDDGKFYVLDVCRMQCQPREFAHVLMQMRVRWPGARMRWYAHSTEREIADLLRELEPGLPLVADIATRDKVVRAGPVAAAWNAGDLLVPRTGGALIPGYQGEELLAPAWVSELVSELADFDGSDGGRDDQVDALAAAFDLVDQMISLNLPRVFESKFGRVPIGSPGRQRENWNKAPKDKPRTRTTPFDWE